MAANIKRNIIVMYIHSGVCLWYEDEQLLVLRKNVLRAFAYEAFRLLGQFLQNKTKKKGGPFSIPYFHNFLGKNLKYS